jgi:hypothetical protein
MMRRRMPTLALTLALGLVVAVPGAAAPTPLPAALAPSTPWTALRDPFQRPVAARAAMPVESAPPAPPAPLRLRALVLNAQRSLANIDGNVVAVGEQFSGYTVRRIDARGVLIVRNGHEQLLTMQDKEFP